MTKSTSCTLYLIVDLIQKLFCTNCIHSSQKPFLELIQQTTEFYFFLKKVLKRLGVQFP